MSNLLADLTAPEWVLIIGAFGAMVVQVITSIRGIITAKETQSKVQETHNAVNSRMDDFLRKMEASHAKLLDSAVRSAFAAGFKKSQDEIEKSNT